MEFAPALFADKPEPHLRRAAAAIMAAAVRASEPRALVLRHVRRDGDRLLAGGAVYDLRHLRRLVVVGGGKACAPMAAALEEVLGERITAGVITVKYGHALPLARVEVVEAGHPLPDAAGQRGAARILELVAGAGADDLVLCVISGGGSALLPAPAPGLALEDKIATTELLLRSGAGIAEVNTVRKHLSRIKGGQLARAAWPAPVLTLILSDVIGNALDAIASGPTVPDPTTFADALAIIARYGLESRLPPAALAYLRRGGAGQAPETPKPGDPVFARTRTAIIGSNEAAVQAAATQARALGFAPTVLPPLAGEARDAARSLVARAEGAPPRTALIAGGETTVTVRGRGRGGRCQEFALAAARLIAGWPRTVVAGFGTDGTDGPTDAAGALADGTTVARARARGLDPEQALADNDAYTFFSALGDLVITGPTRTNVNDLYLLLVD